MALELFFVNVTRRLVSWPLPEGSRGINKSSISLSSFFFPFSAEFFVSTAFVFLYAFEIGVCIVTFDNFY